MKVNILGKGVIPGIGALAPQYNVDLNEAQVKRLLNYQQFRIGDVKTGLLITKSNVDAFFQEPIITELPEVKPIKVPKNVEPEKEVKKETKPVVKEEKPVVETAPELPAVTIEETVVEISTQEPLPEITEPGTVVEVTSVSERIGNVEEVESEEVEEISTEEPQQQFVSNKKKRRKR